MLKLLKNMKKEQWLCTTFVFTLVVAQVWLELKMPDFVIQM